jgi:hypothetical protein
VRMSYIETLIEIMKATRLSPLTVKEIADDTDTLPKSIKPVLDEMAANGLLEVTDRPRSVDPATGNMQGGSPSKQYQMSMQWWQE